jgi:DNA-binding GntR family transcriptional regulator
MYAEIQQKTMTRQHNRPKPTSPSSGLLQPADFTDLHLGDSVYISIKEAISTGHFKPGERLREVSISELLGVSRTPVREALRRLEAEGLATNAAGRGFSVTMLDRQQVLELYVLRETLEGTAAAFAANRASADEIVTLLEILEEEARYLRDGKGVVEINRHFHRELYAASHNRYLIAAVNTLTNSMHLLGGTTLSIPGRAAASHKEHLEIVSYIEQRNPATAGEIARQHIREARRLRLQMLFKYPNSG